MVQNLLLPFPSIYSSPTALSHDSHNAGASIFFVPPRHCQTWPSIGLLAVRDQLAEPKSCMWAVNLSSKFLFLWESKSGWAP